MENEKLNKLYDEFCDEFINMINDRKSIKPEHKKMKEFVDILKKFMKDNGTPEPQKEMTIFEFADFIKANLNISYINNFQLGDDKIFTAKFEHCKLIKGSNSEYIYGSGKSIFEAIDNYIKIISGREILVETMCGETKYIVPDNLIMLKNG